MSSQIRNILIALIVVAILATGYFIASNSNKDDGQQAQGSILISQPDFKVSQLDIETSGNSTKYVKNGINWVVVGNEDIGLVQISIDQLIAYVKNLEYISIVAENLDNAGQFGLTNANVLVLTNEAGSKIQIKVGDRTVDGTGYYVSALGDNNVYIVDAEAGQALKKSPDDMRDRFPEYVNYDNSKYISINKSNGEEYVIKPNPNAVPATGYGEYVISGYYANTMLLLTESLRDNIGAPLYNIYASTFIDEPEDLAVYGLDDPRTTIVAEDNDGNSTTIEIGDETENGDYYAKFSNKAYVCTVNGNNLAVIENAKIFNIIGKFYIPLNTNEIENIEISVGDAKDTFYFEYSTNKLYFNGGEIASSEIADLLKYISLLTADGEISENVINEAVVTQIKVTDIYGNDFSLEFLPYDDNYYAVKYNGETEFITGKKSLDLVISAVNSI